MAVNAKFQVARKDPMNAFYQDGKLMHTVYEKDDDGKFVSRTEECDESETGGWTVLLTPDYAGGRNKEWADATPSGSITLGITNPAAFSQFQPGGKFTVTFEQTED